MTDKDTNLIWVDLEMTGLDPQQDQIIEIATIVTDKDLNILEEGPVVAIYQPDEILLGMDEWNTSHHGQSGLIDRVRSSPDSVGDAERKTLDFVGQHVSARKSPFRCRFATAA